MVYKCCVPGCRGNYPSSEKVSVFRFPEDADLRMKWIRKLTRKNFSPTPHSRVCIKHFDPEDVLWNSSAYDEKTGRLLTAKRYSPRIRDGAVPLFNSSPPSPDLRLVTSNSSHWRGTSLELEDTGCSEEDMTEEKYQPHFRAEEVITDDVPIQESLAPFPVKLIKVSPGNEIPFEQQPFPDEEEDPLRCEEPESENDETCMSENDEDAPFIKTELVEIKEEADITEAENVLQDYAENEEEDVPFEDGSCTFENGDDTPYIKTEALEIKDEIEVKEELNQREKQLSLDEEFLPEDVGTSSSETVFEKQRFPHIENDRMDYLEDNSTSSTEVIALMRQKLGKIFSSSEGNLESGRELSNRHKKHFGCDICGKSFTRRNNLYNHMTLHPEFKPFRCKKCPKIFLRRNLLEIHEYSHTEEKIYPCKICSKKYKAKRTLVAHLKIHDKDMCWLCEVCNKSFTSESQLMRHIVIHTGMRPYKCSICDASFRQMNTLNQHVEMHQLGKFCCRFCPSSYTTKHSLKRHEKVHENEVC